LSISRIPVFVVIAQLAVTSVLAQTTSPPPGSPLLASTVEALLSAREGRRLEYYSGQAMVALLAFRESGQSPEALVPLRRKVLRLVDAGQRSGINLEQTAAYFSAYLLANSRDTGLEAFQGPEGQVNARDLFTTVMENSAETAPAQMVEAPSGPEIPADATAERRAILERVRLRGSDWVITTAAGDTLSLYADALYGDRQQFRRIVAANADVLRRADLIDIGIELVLPKP